MLCNTDLAEKISMYQPVALIEKLKMSYGNKVQNM